MHLYKFDSCFYNVYDRLVQSIPEDLSPEEATIVYEKFSEFASRIGQFKKMFKEQVGQRIKYVVPDECVSVLEKTSFDISRKPPKKKAKLSVKQDTEKPFECKIKTPLPQDAKE